WDTYDTSTYADLKKIVDELHQKGKKVLVYERCGRLDRKYWEEHNAREEYFVKDNEGNTLIEEAPLFNPVDAPNRKLSCFLDLTNPKTLDWWQNYVWKRLLVDIGVDGAKIDFGEEFPENENLRLYSGRTVKGMHHYHPVKYSTMMYRLYQKLRPEGGICWARGGGIGAQRYPFIWCGDQLREFQFLRAILSAILSSGLSGIPFMCHDLAGYMPTRNPEANDEKKVFIRGTELACFTVNMETHGTVTRPYDFPPEVVSVYRFYSKVHYVLIPYLIEQARISCNTGIPLVRHLYLEFPEDKRVYSIEDEYMLGDGLLVAPVLEDSNKRDIYLPKGVWKELWSNREFIGPCELFDYPAPLEIIPVFISSDSKSNVLNKVVEHIRTIELI
ncbi:glycoside hydrolase family 31 protein, partial [bacterium]|nr:glycoside hydrolase family 31 protein [bacterium]